jgi:hypothetical protein
LGLSIVPVQFFAPQWQAQIFFMRAVCGSSRVMP